MMIEDIPGLNRDGCSVVSYLGVAREAVKTAWAVLQFSLDAEENVQCQAFAGVLDPATANKAWLYGAAEALEQAAAHNKGSHLVVCPARYVVENIGLRLLSWRANGWLRSTGEPVANRPEWERVLSARGAQPLTAREPNTLVEEKLCEDAKAWASAKLRNSL